jgi:hypothetical protein
MHHAQRLAMTNLQRVVVLAFNDGYRRPPLLPPPQLPPLPPITAITAAATITAIAAITGTTITTTIAIAVATVITVPITGTNTAGHNTHFILI